MVNRENNIADSKIRPGCQMFLAHKAFICERSLCTLECF